MKFYEQTLTGVIKPVRLVGKESYQRFQDWTLEDEDFVPSPFEGGVEHAQNRLDQLDLEKYAQTRNYLNGGISMLSPYIEHGLVDPTEILKYIDSQQTRLQAYDFLQQLSWRDFYQKKYAENPALIWENIQPYKTGYEHHDYSDTLPNDIMTGTTNVAVINECIEELKKTGYLHNHARLYLASYIVHWRRVKWQVGAKWMLGYLVDGNLASNNYAWQWVASTGSSKAYIFNLENVRKFAKPGMNLAVDENFPLHGTYEALSRRLFPNLKVAASA